MGTSNCNLFRACYSITCVLAETQHQAEEWETLQWKKKEDLMYILIGGSQHGKAVGSITRSGAFYAIG